MNDRLINWFSLFNSNVFDATNNLYFPNSITDWELTSAQCGGKRNNFDSLDNFNSTNKSGFFSSCVCLCSDSGSSSKTANNPKLKFETQLYPLSHTRMPNDY